MSFLALERRPGHELQFSSMIESGVSIARAVFAFNSAFLDPMLNLGRITPEADGRR